MEETRIIASRSTAIKKKCKTGACIAYGIALVLEFLSLQEQELKKSNIEITEQPGSNSEKISKKGKSTLMGHN